MKRSQTKSAFTLVEIMIVVAIIALLAAIAVPSAMRARKRSQAAQILEEVRLLDGALSQYALDNGKSGTDGFTTAIFPPYVKTGSRLYNLLINNVNADVLGNPYFGTTVDAGMHICQATEDAFSDVIPDPAAYWGPYQPLPGLPYQ